MMGMRRHTPMATDGPNAGASSAEAELEDALTRIAELEELYRLTPVGLYVADRNLRLLRVNEMYARISGRRAEDMIGRTLAEVVPESIRAEVIAGARRVLATGEPELGLEFERVENDEAQVLLVSAHPLRRKGEITGLGVVLQDVTSIRRAEEKARQRLQELETVYLTAPVGLSFIDPELRYVRVNQTIAEINGVSVDEIVGKTYRDLSPETADAAEPLLRGIIDRGQSVRNLEVRARPPTDPDVEHVYLLSMEPARDPEGRIRGYSTAVQDVTELRVAEEAAARRLQALEILYAHAPVGLGHLDPELRIVILNARFAQLSDVPRADQIGRPAEEVLPGAIARQIVPQLAYVVRSGGSLANIEIHGHLPHGGSREFAWMANLHPLTSGTGEVTGIVTVLQDVTVMADRQRETERVRDRLAEAQHVARMGSWEWDLIGDQVWWSSELYMIFGESPAYEPTYEGFFEHVHPEDRQKVREQLERTLAADDPYRVAFRIVRRDGSERWLFTAAQLERGDGGLPSRLIGTCQDVSEHVPTRPPRSWGAKKRPKKKTPTR
jgi:PAS domain S-box-containing protein